MSMASRLFPKDPIWHVMHECIQLLRKHPTLFLTVTVSFARQFTDKTLQTNLSIMLSLMQFQLEIFGF